MPLKIESSAFAPGAEISIRYTGEGEDLSPPLGAFQHPVFHDEPFGRRENASSGNSEGLNDWKRTCYGGPAPPIGRHRHFFKLYALDEKLRLAGTPTKAQLEKAMRGHVLAEATLIGTYKARR